MYTVENILDKVQELIGQPIGSFYSISNRIATANAIQRDMVRESNALIGYSTLNVGSGFGSFSSAFSSAFDSSPGTSSSLILPDDFMHFSSRRPIISDGSLQIPIPVVSPRFMDNEYPSWRYHDSVSFSPRYLTKDGRFIGPYPFPIEAFTLEFNYVKTPEELTSLSQLPFDEREDINEFAQGIAYRMASDLMLSINPSVAEYLRRLYNDEVARLRHFTRVDPQKDYHVYPDVGSYYASR